MQGITSTTSEIQNLQDCFTLLYGFMGKYMIDNYSPLGETILREGTRRYGDDRGRYRRDKQLKANYKINMQNLFSVGSDLPSDPRFYGYLADINPQRRTLYNMRCPMAEVWEENDMKEIGRIYCEEFHPACYKAYAFGYTDVHLAKTFTQEGDSYCAFNIVLRPENLPQDLKQVCFEEYDPKYTGPIENLPRSEAKPGFNRLGLKVIYYLFQAFEEKKGEEAAGTFLKECYADYIPFLLSFLREKAKQNAEDFNLEFFQRNYPLHLDLYEDSEWEQYSDSPAKDITQNHLLNPLLDFFSEQNSNEN